MVQYRFLKTSSSSFLKERKLFSVIRNPCGKIFSTIEHVWSLQIDFELLAFQFWCRLTIFNMRFGRLCSPDFRFFGLIICKKSWIFRIRRQKVRIGPPSWWKTTLKWLAKRYFLEDVIVELCQREKLVRHHRKPPEPNFHPDSLPHSQLKRAAISKFRPWLSIEYRFFRSEPRVKNNQLNEIY